MDQYLILAYSLAILTYYLGVLIYAIPIPWWGIKKWAPTLIYDALAASLLVLMFSTIVELVNYLGSLLNVDWQAYFEWLTSRIAIMGSFISFLVTLSLMLSSAGVKAVSTAVLGPIISLATYTLIVLEIFFILGLVFNQFFAKIMIIGILLYSIPFRIARGAGAALVAMSIVFTLALPLLPVFTHAFTIQGTEERILEITEKMGKVNVEEWGIVFVKGHVTDRKGKPVNNILTKWFALLKQGEVYVASYVTLENGWFDAGRPYGGLPYNVMLKLKAEYCGIELTPEPRIIDPHTDFTYNPLKDPNADYFVEIKIKDMITISKYFFVKSNSNEALNTLKITKGGDLVNLKFTISKPATITLVIHKEYNVDKVIVNSTKTIRYSKIKNWGGVSFQIYEVFLNEGTWVLSVRANFQRNVKDPKITDKGYLETISKNIGDFEELGKVIANAVFEWIVLPGTYLSILIMSTYSLAYAIGGRKIRLPIKT